MSCRLTTGRSGRRWGRQRALPAWTPPLVSVLYVAQFEILLPDKAKALTAESNKMLVRRHFDEVFTQTDQRAATEIISPDIVTHNPAFPDDIRGLESVMQTVRMLHDAFPDFHYDLQDLVA
jgi:SnoaL-like polyketide cyclase